mmetsp:Transcript_13841/g.35659  ORF Transcript_13841/g.35659 Transcript_13841/m.35659 type:complete len:106 (-) Transcript_13841:327-644(-)
MGYADSKVTSWAQTIGLVEKTKLLLSSPRLPHSFERFALAAFWIFCLAMIPPSMAVSCVTCKDNISLAHTTAACPLLHGCGGKCCCTGCCFDCVGRHIAVAPSVQ